MSSPIHELTRAFQSRPISSKRNQPKSNKPQAAPQHIDIADRRQVDHWSRYFGVSAGQLCAAVVATSGTTVEVWRLLAMH